jgi:hypothetical protein
VRDSTAAVSATVFSARRCRRHYARPTSTPPQASPTTGPIKDETADSDDAEGHILAQALAASQIVGRRGNGPRPYSKGDEELKPLTKPFPSMREERTRK